MASFLSIYTKQTNLMIFFYFRIFKTIIQKKQTKKNYVHTTTLLRSTCAPMRAWLRVLLVRGYVDALRA